MAKIFVQCTYPQVSSSYVYSFGSYRVDKHTYIHTNKQTSLQTSNAIRYATTLGKNACSSVNPERKSVIQTNFTFNTTINVISAHYLLDSNQRWYEYFYNVPTQPHSPTILSIYSDICSRTKVTKNIPTFKMSSILTCSSGGINTYSKTEILVVKQTTFTFTLATTSNVKYTTSR